MQVCGRWLSTQRHRTHPSLGSCAWREWAEKGARPICCATVLRVTVKLLALLFCIAFRLAQQKDAVAAAAKFRDPAVPWLASEEANHRTPTVSAVMRPRLTKESAAAGDWNVWPALHVTFPDTLLRYNFQGSAPNWQSGGPCHTSGSPTRCSTKTRLGLSTRRNALHHKVRYTANNVKAKQRQPARHAACSFTAWAFAVRSSGPLAPQ